MIRGVTSADKGETVSHHLTTIPEASAEFGVGIGTLYAWVLLGEIPHSTTSGGLVLIRRVVVQRAVTAHAREDREQRDDSVPIHESGRITEAASPSFPVLSSNVESDDYTSIVFDHATRIIACRRDRSPLERALRSQDPGR
jgi:hypothetical protein